MGRCGRPRCQAHRFLADQPFRTDVGHVVDEVGWFSLPADSLFSHPDVADPNALASWIDRTGHMQVWWFPFTTMPWLRVLNVEPEKPATSHEVDQPYNYPFLDRIPDEVSALHAEIIKGNPSLTPAAQAARAANISVGLTTSVARDLWGWSKNLILCIRPTVPRVANRSWAILTSRANILRVANEYYTFCDTLVNQYAARGEYPIKT